MANRSETGRDQGTPEISDQEIRSSALYQRLQSEFEQWQKSHSGTSDDVRRKSSGDDKNLPPSFNPDDYFEIPIHYPPEVKALFIADKESEGITIIDRPLTPSLVKNKYIELKPEQINSLRQSEDYAIMMAVIKEHLEDFFGIKNDQTEEAFVNAFDKLMPDDKPISDEVKYLVWKDLQKMINNIKEGRPLKEIKFNFKDLEDGSDLIEEAKYLHDIGSQEEGVVEVQPKGKNDPEKKQEQENIFHTPEFAFLSNLYIQGMEPQEMKDRLLGGKKSLENLVKNYTDAAEYKDIIFGAKWHDRVKEFVRLIEQDGVNPAGYFMTEVLVSRPGFSFDRLNAAPGKKDPASLTDKDREKYKKAYALSVAELWQDINYSSSHTGYGKEGRYVMPIKDLDVKVSLFSLSQAGVKAADKAEPIKAGKFKEGATTIDSGGIAGVKLVIDKEGKPTLILDNHPKGRTLVETSTAKQIYRMLLVGECIDAKDQALKVMVEIAGADDNGRLINSKEKFFNSGHTLYGLAKRFKDDNKELVAQFHDAGSALHDCIRKVWAKVCKEKYGSENFVPGNDKSWWSIYNEVLSYDIASDKDFEIYNLADEQASQKKVIDSTKQILEQPPETLKEQGRVIEDKKHHKYLINIIGLEKKDKSYQGGYIGALVYGYDGVISYTPKDRSFNASILNHSKDIGDVFKVKDGNFAIEKDGQLQVVENTFVTRNMVGKPNDGLRLDLDILDIIHQIDPNYEPVGIVKEYLEQDRLRREKLKEKRAVKPDDKSKGTVVIDESTTPQVVTDQDITPVKEGGNEMGWVDEYGIKFSRTLTKEEEGKYLDIIASYESDFTNLAKNHPQYPKDDPAQKATFEAYMINQGFNHPDIKKVLTEEYKLIGLPVVEKSDKGQS